MRGLSVEEKGEVWEERWAWWGYVLDLGCFGVGPWGLGVNLMRAVAHVWILCRHWLLA